VVVGFDLLRRDADALAETLLDEAQDLNAVAEISLDQRWVRAWVNRKALHPALRRNSRGRRREAPCGFRSAGHRLRPARLGGLGVFLMHLLLDERAADQLIEGARASKKPRPPLRGRARKGGFVLNIAGQNGLVVHHSYHAVENDGAAGWGVCAWVRIEAQQRDKQQVRQRATRPAPWSRIGGCFRIRRLVPAEKEVEVAASPTLAGAVGWSSCRSLEMGVFRL